MVSEISKDGPTDWLTRAITKDPLGRTRGPKSYRETNLQIYNILAIISSKIFHESFINSSRRTNSWNIHLFLALGNIEFYCLIWKSTWKYQKKSSRPSGLPNNTDEQKNNFEIHSRWVIQGLINRNKSHSPIVYFKKFSLFSFASEQFPRAFQWLVALT